jgi:hypothetical protein
MKTKLLMTCLVLSLIIAGCGAGQSLGPASTATPPGPERVFYNFIVSVKTGADIASAEAYVFSNKLEATAYVTTLAQIQEQMPEGTKLEITENGPLQICTFTFGDSSQLIVEMVLKN